MFCGEDFLSFAVLMVGYGMWGDFVYEAKKNENYGRLRYLSKWAFSFFMPDSGRHIELLLTIPMSVCMP